MAMAVLQLIGIMILILSFPGHEQHLPIWTSVIGGMLFVIPSLKKAAK